MPSSSSQQDNKGSKLREQIRALVEKYASHNVIPAISRISEIHRSNIDRYLSGEKGMRLYNVGRLIAALQRFIHGIDPHAAREASISLLASNLSREEYQQFNVSGADELITLLSEDLTEDLATPKLPDKQAMKYAESRSRDFLTISVGDGKILYDEDRRPEERLFIPQREVGSDQFIHVKLREWITDMSPSAGNFCVLRGDIGMGKTTALRHLAYLLAEEYDKTDGESIWPLYLNLSNFPSDMDTFLKANLHGRLSEIQGLEHLQRLADAGRVVFLLDSFDEMSSLRTKENTINNLRKVGALIRPGGKLVLAVRKQLFFSDADFDNALRLSGIDVTSSVCMIEPDYFSVPEVKRYIRVYSGCKDDSLYDRLSGLLGFAKLSRHPMMLEIIMQLDHAGLFEKFFDKKTISVVDIFDEYFIGWFKRNFKNRTIKDIKTVDRICQKMACSLFSSDNLFAEQSDLEGWTRSAFEKSEESKEIATVPENFFLSIATDSFITNIDGRFKFTHEVFRCYFLAKWISGSVISCEIKVVDDGDNEIIEVIRGNEEDTKLRATQKHYKEALGSNRIDEAVVMFLQEMPGNLGSMLHIWREVSGPQESSRAAQDSSRKTLESNVEEILIAQGLESKLWKSLGDPLFKKITSLGMLGTALLINGVLRQITTKMVDGKENRDFSELPHLSLPSLIHIMLGEVLRNVPAPFIKNFDDTVVLLQRFAHTQHKKSSSVANAFCDPSEFEELNVKENRGRIKNSFGPAHAFLLVCPDLFSFDSHNQFHFKHEFWFHYFLAGFWLKQIREKTPDGLGISPPFRKTVEWLLAITQQEDICVTDRPNGNIHKEDGVFLDVSVPEDEKHIPGEISRILIEWFVKTLNSEWEKSRGWYFASFLLSILARTGLDLSGVPLRKGRYLRCDLSCGQDNSISFAGQNLSGIQFHESYLTGCDLTGCNLAGSQLASVDFKGAFFKDAEFTDSILSDVDFTGAQDLVWDNMKCHSMEKIIKPDGTKHNYSD